MARADPTCPAPAFIEGVFSVPGPEPSIRRSSAPRVDAGGISDRNVFVPSWVRLGHVAGDLAGRSCHGGQFAYLTRLDQPASGRSRQRADLKSTCLIGLDSHHRLPRAQPAVRLP